MDGDDRIFRAQDGSALRFFSEAVRNNFQSERLGRSVFDTVLFVEVITPGQSESIPRFELERVYSENLNLDGSKLVERYEKYEMFKEQIEAYKSQETGTGHEGTPIGSWANIDAGTAATLKSAGVFTVEMLADVSDGNLQKLGMGGRVLRDQAAAYLQSRTFGLPSAQLAAEKAHLTEEVDRLTQLIKDKDATIAELSHKLQAANTQPAPAPVDTGAAAQALDPFGTAEQAPPPPPPPAAAKKSTGKVI